MSRPRPFWVMPEYTVAPEFIDAVEDAANSVEPQDASLMGGKQNPNIRVSSIRFLDPTQFKDIADHVFDIVSQINAEFFGVDIQSVQALQHTTYNKGAHYKPHVDVEWETNPESSIFDRKLSVSILLTDPSEFKGGDLIIEGQKVELVRGGIVVFPSYAPHEVTRVTKGTRTSLVSWIWGPRWR